MSVDFTHTRVVTAAKQHTCVFCLRVIKKGEKHQVHSGKFEGNMSRVRTHKGAPECLNNEP